MDVSLEDVVVEHFEENINPWRAWPPSRDNELNRGGRLNHEAAFEKRLSPSC